MGAQAARHSPRHVELQATCPHHRGAHPGGSERWFEETAALQPGDTEGFLASCQLHGIEFFPELPVAAEAPRTLPALSPAAHHPAGPPTPQPRPPARITILPVRLHRPACRSLPACISAALCSPAPDQGGSPRVTRSQARQAARFWHGRAFGDGAAGAGSTGLAASCAGHEDGQDRHLMEQPMLGRCGSGTGWPARVSSMAARSSPPVTGLPLPGVDWSNAPR
jgi:hypothetical protein